MDTHPRSHTFRIYTAYPLVFCDCLQRAMRKITNIDGVIVIVTTCIEAFLTVILATCNGTFFTVPVVPQFPCELKEPLPSDSAKPVCLKMAQDTSPDEGVIKPQGTATTSHTVTLVWNPSSSLSHPPADGEGYNVYRLNQDCSCVKLRDMLKDTTSQDLSVEAGRSYRYAATAVRERGQQSNTHVRAESDPSDVVEVHIPPS